MYSTILRAGRHTLTDANAVYLLGEILITDHPSMATVVVDGVTKIFPVVTGLSTAETDIMYGRLVQTPAGIVRVEDAMAIVPLDEPVCVATHPQSAFWGTIDLDVDTELSWGPGWYQLAGQDRVDLMTRQVTAFTCYDLPNHEELTEILTVEEFKAMGLTMRAFHNSTVRYHSDVDYFIAQATRYRVDTLIPKLERLRAAGAEEITEILVVPAPSAERPAQLRPQPNVVGMTGGSYYLICGHRETMDGAD